VANGKGRLIQIENSSSVTDYTGCDALGRILASDQGTAGLNYFFSYTYKPRGSAEVGDVSIGAGGGDVL
jgi:hypothetical protein